jgi:hypothetical protein
MSSFHKSNLGQFGDSLPCDMDGYVHTTAQEWLAAPVDFGGEKWSNVELHDWAKEKAAECRDAIKRSESALQEWRASN